MAYVVVACVCVCVGGVPTMGRSELERRYPPEFVLLLLFVFATLFSNTTYVYNTRVCISAKYEM